METSDRINWQALREELVASHGQWMKVDDILAVVRSHLQSEPVKEPDAQADYEDYGTDIALDWLDNLINEGRGAVVFANTENGDIGLWVQQPNDATPAIGTGDTAIDAIIDARIRLRAGHPSALASYYATTGMPYREAPSSEPVKVPEPEPVHRCLDCGATRNVFGLPFWCDIDRATLSPGLHDDPRSVTVECQKRPHTCLHHHRTDQPDLTAEQQEESAIGFEPVSRQREETEAEKARRVVHEALDAVLDSLIADPLLSQSCALYGYAATVESGLVLGVKWPAIGAVIAARQSAAKGDRDAIHPDR